MEMRMLNTFGTGLTLLVPGWARWLASTQPSLDHLTGVAVILLHLPLLIGSAGGRITIFRRQDHSRSLDKHKVLIMSTHF